MLFNSIDFAIFLPLVFVLYWFVTSKNLKLQNILVVVASYVFYLSKENGRWKIDMIKPNGDPMPKGPKEGPR